MKWLTLSPETMPKANRFSGATEVGNHFRSLPALLGLPLILPIFFLCAAWLVQPCAATPGQWEYTGSFNTARFHHTATLLPDGRVLAAGGEQYHFPMASAELYDPATGTWSYTANLSIARDSHTASLLPEGKVLVAGGRETHPGNGLASAELYDPATETWSPTGSLKTGRIFHTATLLLSGKVLVAGGKLTDVSLASAELYDPATGRWSFTGRLAAGRVFHTATLLQDGKVLVAGGRDSNGDKVTSCELYDPATGGWSVTGSLNIPRYDHTATLLLDGKVIVVGGNGEIASTELYDPATGSWAATGSLNNPRADQVEALLPNGMALVAGGTGFDPDTAELYDPATGAWSLTGSLNAERKDHAATLLPSGMVLVSGGGFDDSIPIASTELYESGSIVATQVNGHGTFANQENRVTFRVRAGQSDNRDDAEFFSFCDPTAGVCLTKAGIKTVSINGNSAECTGKAHLDDGAKVTYTVDMTDNGEPGSLDTISISLSNGYFATGNLISGDIRIY